VQASVPHSPGFLRAAFGFGSGTTATCMPGTGIPALPPPLRPFLTLLAYMRLPYLQRPSRLLLYICPAPKQHRRPVSPRAIWTTRAARV